MNRVIIAANITFVSNSGLLHNWFNPKENDESPQLIILMGNKYISRFNTKEIFKYLILKFNQSGACRSRRQTPTP